MTTKEANKSLQVSRSPLHVIEAICCADLEYHEVTDSKAKHELLFSRFRINYNDLPQQFRKGSVVIRIDAASGLEHTPEEEVKGIDGTVDDVRKLQPRKRKPPRPYEGLTGDVTVSHEDIIQDRFWEERPWLLI